MQEIRIPLWDNIFLVAEGIEDDPLECRGVFVTIEKDGKWLQDLASIRIACYHDENMGEVPIRGKYEIGVYSNVYNKDWENRFVVDERKD